MQVWTYRLKSTAVIHRLTFRAFWSEKNEDMILQPNTPCGLSQEVLLDAVRMEKLVARPVDEVSCRVCSSKPLRLEDQAEGIIRDRLIALRISRDYRFKDMLAFYDEDRLKSADSVKVLADWMEEQGFEESHLLRFIVCDSGPVDVFIKDVERGGHFFLTFY